MRQKAPPWEGEKSQIFPPAPDPILSPSVHSLFYQSTNFLGHFHLNASFQKFTFKHSYYHEYFTSFKMKFNNILPRAKCKNHHPREIIPSQRYQFLRTKMQIRRLPSWFKSTFYNQLYQFLCDKIFFQNIFHNNCRQPLFHCRNLYCRHLTQTTTSNISPYHLLQTKIAFMASAPPPSE